jgi:putative hydrolase of the HAD superfamily
MKYKYIILDFGKVLAYPTTGNWFVTPKFLELIDIDFIDKDKLKIAIKNNINITKRKILNLDEEYTMFYEFYKNILNEIGIKNEEITKKIANNITYKSDKYKLYDNVKDELKYLNKKYKLILLSDNWPCVKEILKENNLDNYFDKMYISSIFGYEKQDRKLFDYPIQKYNIKKGEALFIDDNELNLDIGKEKGFEVIQMSRNGNVNSKYEIIHNLYEIK